MTLHVRQIAVNDVRFVAVADVQWGNDEVVTDQREINHWKYTLEKTRRKSVRAGRDGVRADYAACAEYGAALADQTYHPTKRPVLVRRPVR